jgi:hypothetical protein
MSALPQESQPRMALRLANDVRGAVAEFKRDVKVLSQREGLRWVIDAVEHLHDEPLLGAAKVRHLLMAVDRIGEHKARKLLTASQVYDHDKRLRDLTARQRYLLAYLLSTEGWRS